MSLVNREFQRILLETLREEFPHYMERVTLGRNIKKHQRVNEATYDSKTDKIFEFNFYYLIEHGLIKQHNFQDDELEDYYQPKYRITPKGIDFLENDGGISAILNTVTVKFDVNNVRELVEAGLLKANVSEERKSVLKEALRKAPGIIFQKITDKLLEKAVNDPMTLMKTLGEVFDKAF